MYSCAHALQINSIGAVLSCESMDEYCNNEDAVRMPFADASRCCEHASNRIYSGGQTRHSRLIRLFVALPRRFLP